MSVLHEVHDRVEEKPPYVELEDVPEEAPAAKAERLWQLLHDREASPLSDLFQGQLESRVTCNKCSSTFFTYEPFMDLSLSLFKEGAPPRRCACAGCRSPFVPLADGMQ